MPTRKRPASSLASESLAPMSLEEKLELFRQKNDQQAPLPQLTVQEQKRLAGKFNYELDKTPEAKAVVGSACSEASAGSKNKARQDFVKSWILAGGFGEKLFAIVEEVKVGKSFSQVEKPVSMKELQQRYTDEQIGQLLSEGGIRECRHSKYGSITMYVDHSNWSKERRVEASKSLSSSRRKAMDEDEDRAFDAFLKKVNLNESTLAEIEGVKLHEPEEGEGVIKIYTDEQPSITSKRSKNTIDYGDDIEKMYKQLPGMCKLLINKKVSLMMLHSSKKKSSGYGKALKSSSEKLMEKLEQHADRLCAASACKKPGTTEMKGMIDASTALLLEASRHIGLLNMLP